MKNEQGGLAEENNTVNVIIETPKGSSNKYAWDPENKAYKLKKTLPLGMTFPFDFGFIPGTKGEDGDPLDVLVIMDQPAYPGVLVECVMAGVLKAEQTEHGKTVRNDRLIGISATSVLYKGFRTIDDLHSNITEQIQNFFIFYNKQAGREFRPLDWKGPSKAMSLIRDAS